MDIKYFIFFLFFISIGIYFIPVENVQKNDVDKDIPLVIFEEPLMFSLNEQNLSRIVQASHVVRYKSRDEIFDSSLIINNINKDFKVEKLKADIIIKRDDLYTLIDNVVYERDDFLSFNTNEMYYNETKKLAYNYQKFSGKYYDNKLSGENLYLDANKKLFESKNVNFTIDMK